MMSFRVVRMRQAQVLALFLLLLGALLTASAPAGARERVLPAGGDFASFLPLILYGEGGGAPPDGDMVMYTLGDAQMLAPASEIEDDLELFKALECDTGALPAPATLTLAQAKANARAYMDQLAGPGAMAGLDAYLAGRALGQFDAMVMATTAVGETDAALATLLIAIERFPLEPMPLVNAAGLLSISGMPNEAIAFLDAAQALGRPYGAPMGVDGEQMARNNRAHALLGRGQWAQAGAILQEVVQAEPQLAEARVNLSRALLCQGDTPGAALWYRLGQRRMMWDVVQDPPEITGQMIPIEYILDTSAGELLTVSDVPRPATPDKLADFSEMYGRMKDDYNARLQTLTAQRPALEDAYYNRTLPYLQRMRLNSLLAAVSLAQEQPQVRDLWDESAVLWDELRQMEDQITVDLTILWQSGGDLEQIKQQCRDMVGDHVTQYTAKYYEYEIVLQEYMILLYAIQTGVLTNAHDAALHALMMNHIEANVETTYQLLVPHGWTINMNGHWTLCDGNVEDGEEEEEETPGMPPPARCSDDAKKTKIAVDIVIASLAFGCEVSEAELSLPTPIAPFLQVTHDMRKNEVTVFLGAKFQTRIGPLAELNTKEGFYVRFNSQEFLDAGMKLTSGGSVLLGGTGISGQIDGPEFEAGVAAATQYWTDPYYRQ